MNSTLQKLAVAFENWETDYRAQPTMFLTEDEIRVLGVSEVSAQRAEYFHQLLKNGDDTNEVVL